MYGFVREVIADKGRQVYSVSPHVTVREAVRVMNEHGVGAVLVVEGRKALGIFTERDVLRRVVDVGRSPETTRVAEVMTRDLLVVQPGTRVQEAMATMTERRCRHLPVIDGGEIIAMVSIGDLTRRASLNQEAHIQALTDYITGRA